MSRIYENIIVAMNNLTTQMVGPSKLSVKQRQKKKQAIEEVKRKLSDYIEKKKNKKRIMFAPPPYDDVFYEALETFDLLDGEDEIRSRD